jgi:Zn-dependent metalloprotease
VNRNHRLAALAAATTLALSAQGAIAAQRTDLHRLNVAQVNAQRQGSRRSRGHRAASRERHAEKLNMDANSNLRELRTNIDKDGTRHTRYQQTFPRHPGLRRARGGHRRQGRQRPQHLRPHGQRPRR